MYEIFETLLTLHGVTAYQVSKATGIATATLSDWKRGRSKPKQDKLQKIADYFHVPLDYLIHGEITDSSYDAATASLMHHIMKREKLQTLLKYSIQADDSDISLAIEVLKALQAKGKTK